MMVGVARRSHGFSMRLGWRRPQLVKSGGGSGKGTVKKELRLKLRVQDFIV